MQSCDSNKGPDVSHINLEVTPKLFYDDLFKINETNIETELPVLKDRYQSYLNAYSQQIIKIGSPESAEYPNYILSFLNYEDNQDVYEKCQEAFAEVGDLSDELTSAFKHYKYYFPGKSIPEVYFHTSYFNQSIALDSNWVSVSVEKYLGAECEFYEWLSVPKYLRRKMTPEKIVPDVMKAMALSNFSQTTKNIDLISNMVQQGRLQYFIHQMIPEINDTILFDYSRDQMKWLKKHEADIWSILVEQKHLYNTDRMLIQKYVGDSPFTYYFGQESPGKAAVFLGYQIVQAYMDESNLSLKDLMNERDAHKIFREARYRP